MPSKMRPQPGQPQVDVDRGGHHQAERDEGGHHGEAEGQAQSAAVKPGWLGMAVKAEKVKPPVNVSSEKRRRRERHQEEDAGENETMPRHQAMVRRRTRRPGRRRPGQAVWPSRSNSDRLCD